MKGVQCYELFGGIALKNHTFSFSLTRCKFSILSKGLKVYLGKTKIMISGDITKDVMS